MLEKTGCERDEILETPTLKDYLTLHLETDMLLLVDVFESVSDQCLDYYEIDPCSTFSTRGSTWICGLIYTGVNLKHLKEETVNIYNTIQKGIRGGLASVLGYCHVKCENKQIDSDYTGKKTIRNIKISIHYIPLLWYKLYLLIRPAYVLN